jgi:GTPase SAR1 family protein
VHFVIIDVGGQRSERRKWMHAFDEVTAVIFVAALSEFDQKMFEDTSANRMVDALELFDKTCNGAVFKNTPIILFLNKSDLFRTKIAETQIATTPAFGDYPGKPHDYDDGIE